MTGVILFLFSFIFFLPCPSVPAFPCWLPVLLSVWFRRSCSRKCRQLGISPSFPCRWTPPHLFCPPSPHGGSGHPFYLHSTPAPGCRFLLCRTLHCVQIVQPLRIIRFLFCLPGSLRICLRRYGVSSLYSRSLAFLRSLAGA